MSNLLQETKATLEACEKTPEDVKWVGSGDGKYAISWAEFEPLADVEYYSGYGGQDIVSDLVVVGEGWWLSRGEYDGSEWWMFNTPPTLKEATLPFTRVTDPRGHSWVTIEDAHKPGGKYGDLDES
jgi:hypothetical protein